MVLFSYFILLYSCGFWGFKNLVVVVDKVGPRGRSEARVGNGIVGYGGWYGGIVVWSCARVRVAVAVVVIEVVRSCPCGYRCTEIYFHGF